MTAVAAGVATIDGIAAGGSGVGRLEDGRAVFVPRTAPGDEAEIRLTREKARWATASLVTLRTASPQRRTAPCPLYSACGGCSIQHLQYDAQRAAKASIVAEALRRIGGLDVDAPEVVASPAEFRYRNRATFTVVRAGGRVFAGFHALERPGRIVDVDDRCMLLEPALAACWRSLRAAWGETADALPAGAKLRVTVRAAEGGCSLLIEGGRGRGQPEVLLAGVPALRSIWTRRDPSSPPRLVAGEPSVEETWGDLRLHLRGAAFLQVNRQTARALEDHLIAACGDVAGRTVIDAYCGVGLTAHRLAAAGARVTGIERDADAVREATALTPDARFVAGAVEERIGAALPADIVILNPPRGGVDPAVCDALRTRPPGRILYVSCDPATLARDVRRLGDGCRLRAVRCFDMFPQTAHVETVLELECATS